MMTFRIRVGAVVAALAVAATGFAQPPKSPGSSNWEKEFPKVTPAAAGQPAGSIEVFGKYTASGYELKSAEMFYSQRGGGPMVSGGKLDYADGFWGEKKGGKIVPKKVAIPKGEWQVWVITTFIPANGGPPIEFWSDFHKITIE